MAFPIYNVEEVARVELLYQASIARTLEVLRERHRRLTCQIEALAPHSDKRQRTLTRKR